jgi:hypothetical protein
VRIFREPRSQPMSEALAYARCHGARRGNIVGVVKSEPRQRPYELPAPGEALRQPLESPHPG